MGTNIYHSLPSGPNWPPLVPRLSGLSPDGSHVRREKTRCVVQGGGQVTLVGTVGISNHPVELPPVTGGGGGGGGVHTFLVGLCVGIGGFCWVSRF